MSVAKRRHPMLTGLVALMLVAMAATTAAVGRGPAGVVAQDADPSLAAVAPETAAFYLSVSLDTTGAQWTQTETLLERAGLGNSVEEALGSVSETVGQDVDLDDELAPFLGGELAIVAYEEALTAVAGEFDVADLVGGLPVPTVDATTPAGGESGVAVVARPSDPAAAWAAVQEGLQEDATAAGVTVEETIYEGVTILSVPGDPALDDDGTAIAQVGDLILLGTAPGDLEPIIDTQAGRVAPLSEVAEFQQLLAALPAERLAFGYVNGNALQDALSAEDLAAFGGVSALGGALDAKSGFTVRAEDVGFRLDTLSIPGPTQPPLPANADPTLDERVPADSLVFFDGYDLGRTGALDVILLAFAQGVIGEMPMGSPTAGEPTPEQVFALAEQLLGFNLKTAFIDQMVGEYGFALWGLDLIDLSQTGGVLVSGVAEPAVLSDTVSKLSLLVQAAGQGQYAVTTRQVGEAVVSSVDLTATGTPTKIEYGVIDDEFVLGIGTGLDDYVGGVTDALANDPTYQAALAELPAEHNSVFYLDLGQLVPLVTATLEGMMGATTFEIEDAGEQCANYGTQAAAQEAYEADPITNYDLDQDFDGQACEDYFNPATPEPTPAALGGDLAALSAIATVGFVQDGLNGTGTILLIEERSGS